MPPEIEFNQPREFLEIIAEVEKKYFIKVKKKSI